MKPILGITMGDAAGIGPELILKAFRSPELFERCRPLVVGSRAVMDLYQRLLDIQVPMRSVTSAEEALYGPGTLDILDLGLVDAAALAIGKVAAEPGNASVVYTQAAGRLALEGAIDAIVSAPLNKETFHMAGYTAMDDMTYFQECFATGEAYQVGEVAGLWTTPVTFHVPFRRIPDLITKEAVLSKIRILHQVMTAAKVTPVKIGVAALNVHGGEGGMFGREEIDIIGPAIQQAKAEGINVVGPIPADSFFPLALRGDFKGMVFMYHDQANIGRKILGRDSPGVSLFLGMPVPVVTVPHGTAYDIAWKGVAKHAMIVHAITMAVSLAQGSAPATGK